MLLENVGNERHCLYDSNTHLQLPHDVKTWRHTHTYMHVQQAAFIFHLPNPLNLWLADVDVNN